MGYFYYMVSVIVFIFGLIIGSFLNCVIYRIGISESRPRRESVSFLRGRSFCPNCKHTLFWRDLVPLFSFLFLKGKCRYCGKKISWQYPLVEITTALLFLLIFNYQFNSSVVILGAARDFVSFLSNMGFLASLGMTIFLFIIASFFILIFVHDLKYFIIPDKIVYPAIAIVFLYQLFGILRYAQTLVPGAKIEFGAFSILLNYFASAGGVAVFFLLIFLISRGKWIGFGDVKLGFLLGLFLGFPKIAVALFISYLVGAIIGLGIIFWKKATMKTEVPFGPFLIFGTFVALFFGDFLANWYLNFIP